jgi:hypothetical protein
VVHYSKFKRSLLATFCGFSFVSATAHANTHCPDLSITAFCVNGAWQISITPNDPYWVFMGDSVNGSYCTDDEHAHEVQWNYAFSSARMGMVGCNYRLLNDKLHLIGLIQIISNQYVRTGSNWHKDSYPGNWTCRESQQTCLFC